MGRRHPQPDVAHGAWRQFGQRSTVVVTEDAENPDEIEAQRERITYTPLDHVRREAGAAFRVRTGVGNLAFSQPATGEADGGLERCGARMTPHTRNCDPVRTNL